jgi:hypothetical protein
MAVEGEQEHQECPQQETQEMNKFFYKVLLLNTCMYRN